MEEFRRTRERDMAEIRRFQILTEQNLAEITDKLNGPIGYRDGQEWRPGA